MCEAHLPGKVMSQWLQSHPRARQCQQLSLGMTKALGDSRGWGYKVDLSGKDEKWRPDVKATLTASFPCLGLFCSPSIPTWPWVSMWHSHPESSVEAEDRVGDLGPCCCHGDNLIVPTSLAPLKDLRMKLLLPYILQISCLSAEVTWGKPESQDTLWGRCPLGSTDLSNCLGRLIWTTRIEEVLLAA